MRPYLKKPFTKRKKKVSYRKCRKIGTVVHVCQSKERRLK
jgi:hypothetical protein